MIYLTAPGQGILVLGSHRRAFDLLDKRSANYSDRPALPIIDMWVTLLSSWSLRLIPSHCGHRITSRMNLEWSFGLMPYGTMWRQHSRTFHKYFNNNAVQQYHPIMYEETKTFLRKVNSQPSDIFEHMQMYVVSVFTS